MVMKMEDLSPREQRAAKFVWYTVWGYAEDIPVSEDTLGMAHQWARGFGIVEALPDSVSDELRRIADHVDFLERHIEQAP